jgi:hypothetical protein
MLRAFVDESGSADADGIFVMAGLVAFVKPWEATAEHWNHILQLDPPISFFKTSNFRSSKWRKAQGLTESDTLSKTAMLARLLTYPPLLFSVCVTIKKSEYRDVVESSGILKKKIGRLAKLWTKTPYNFCFHNIISMTLRKLDELGVCGDVVDFVFDRNDPHFDAANEMLRGLRAGVLTPAKWNNALGDAIPGNDETIAPLQMADLVAGRLKDHCSSPRKKHLIKDVLQVTGVGENNITWHVRRPKIENLINKLVQGLPL